MPTQTAAAAAGSSFLNSIGTGAGTAAGSGLMGQIFGGLNARRQWKYQKKAMELQQKYALEQMKYQYDLGLQRFDYENKYNDPRAMMARYRSAGINPSAVLGGSGASVQGTMSPSGGSLAGTPSGGSMVSPAPTMDINQGALLRSQIRLNDTASDRNASESDLLGAKVITEDYVRSNIESETNKNVVDAYYLSMQADLARIDLDSRGKINEATLRNIQAQTDNLITSAALNTAQSQLVRAYAISEVLHREVMAAQRDMFKASTKESRARARLISFQSQDLENNIKSLSQAGEVTCYTLDEEGELQLSTYKLSGYDARAAIMRLGAAAGASRAAASAIDADWSNADHWTETITSYVDSAVGLAEGIMDAIFKTGKLKTAARVADAAEQNASTYETQVEHNTRMNTHTVDRYYDHDGNFRGKKISTTDRY